MPAGPIVGAAGGGGEYDAYTQDHRYEHDTGIVALPVCGPTPKVRLIRLHGGAGIRRIKWRAVRQGTPPVVPTAQDTTADKLLHSTVTPSLPVADQGTGRYTFAVTGEYVYAQITPRVCGTNTLPTGAFPFRIDPMDSQAKELAGQVSQSGTFDQWADRIADGVYSAAPAGTPWPFTFIPPKFTAATFVL